jgi:tetratricopeptide (TPR) repeat protein
MKGFSTTTWASPFPWQAGTKNPSMPSGRPLVREPKERVYNNLGLVLAKTGRYDAALDAFMKGSDRAKAYNNLGCVYLSQGDYRKAAQAFNKAIESSPTFYTTAHENLKKIQMETAIK